MMLESDALFLGAGAVFGAGLLTMSGNRNELQIRFSICAAVLQRDNVIGMRRLFRRNLPACDCASSVLAQKQPIYDSLGRTRVRRAPNPFLSSAARKDKFSHGAAPQKS